MRKLFSHSLKVILPLQLAACGSDTPSFHEKPQAIIKMSVNKVEDPAQASGESFDMETLSAGDASSSVDSADAIVGNSIGNDDNLVRPGSTRDTTAQGRGPATTPSPLDENVPVPGRGPNTQPMPVPDAKAVAKACAPAMRNLGKAMTVVSIHESNSTVTISPNSVMALKITGNRTKVVLDLDGETPMLGVCFFLAGHETELQFSTASSVKSLAIVEAGDQAKAHVVLTGGSSESLSVDLRGHAPSLAIEGVTSELCDMARPRSGTAHFSCQP